MGEQGGDEYKNEEDDPFSAVLREMKLKGEFPCRLCHAVFPNLRALKGNSFTLITFKTQEKAIESNKNH